MFAKPLALQGEAIKPEHHYFGLAAHDIRAKLGSETCYALDLRNGHVVFLYYFARNECEIT
jgi:hypothetical protein